MTTPDMVMYEDEYQRIKAVIARLRTESNAKLVFLVDKNGQQIAAHDGDRVQLADQRRVVLVVRPAQIVLRSAVLHHELQ